MKIFFQVDPPDSEVQRDLLQALNLRLKHERRQCSGKIMKVHIDIVTDIRLNVAGSWQALHNPLPVGKIVV